MKPDRGGRPPKERRIKGVMVVRTGVLAHEAASALTVVEELDLKIIKVEKVIGM